MLSNPPPIIGGLAEGLYDLRVPKRLRSAYRARDKLEKQRENIEEQCDKALLLLEAKFIEQESKIDRLQDEAGIFRRNPSRHFGRSGKYKWEIRRHDRPSRYGIDGGRITDLEIFDTDNQFMTHANYNKFFGWDIPPDNEVTGLYNELIDRYNNPNQAEVLLWGVIVLIVTAVVGKVWR